MVPGVPTALSCRCSFALLSSVFLERRTRAISFSPTAPLNTLVVISPCIPAADSSGPGAVVPFTEPPSQLPFRLRFGQFWMEGSAFPSYPVLHLRSSKSWNSFFSKEQQQQRPLPWQNLYRLRGSPSAVKKKPGRGPMRLTGCAQSRKRRASCSSCFRRQVHVALRKQTEESQEHQKSSEGSGQ